MEGETQELEPSCHGMNPGLRLSHLQPDIEEHFSDKGIGNLSFQAGAGEDHEVIGVANEPEPGLLDHDIEAMEVDVGKER